jgi:hypothetical protein
MSEQQAGAASFDKVGALIAHWKAESKRVKELADKERSKSGRESLMAQSVRYWMCADELEAALASQTPTPPVGEERIQKLISDLGNAAAFFSMDYNAAKERGEYLDHGLDSIIEPIVRNWLPVGPTSETGSIPAGARLCEISEYLKSISWSDGLCNNPDLDEIADELRTLAAIVRKGGK